MAVIFRATHQSNALSTRFTVNRVDRTYEIDSDGKFVLVNTKRYKAKTYTREMLADKAYNIYSDKGTEE